MEPVVKSFPAFKAVGMRYFGNNENNEIPKMWGEFVPRMEEIKSAKEDGYAFGICSPMNQNSEKGFEYISCLEVNDFNDVPEGMVTADIPEGKYAVHTYKGSIANISTIYNYIFGKWVKETDMEVDRDRSDFELYDHRFKGESEDSELDIYIPIKD